MKLGNWIAVLGCLALGVGGAIAAQGCTTSVCTGTACGEQGTGNTQSTGTDSGGGGSTSNDAGSDGVGVGNDASVAETGSTPADPCNSCLYSQCVGAYANCVGNASCLAIYQCATVPACAVDGSCVQGCYDGDGGSTTDGQQLYVALGNCNLAAECTASAPCAAKCNPSAATCESGDGGGEDAAPTDDAGGDATQTCASCQAASCSGQLADCAAGTQCAAYNQCVLGCTDSPCTDACSTSNTAGYTAAQALGTCTTTSCGSLCN